MDGPFVQHLCLVGVARHLATVWIMFSSVSLAASTRRGTMTCRTPGAYTGGGGGGGGSPLPMKPPRSFKFRFKINGICRMCRMCAHCVRARFAIDPGRVSSHAHGDVHATFKHLNVAAQSAQDRVCTCSSGRCEYYLLTAAGCPGAVSAGHFCATR